MDRWVGCQFLANAEFFNNVEKVLGTGICVIPILFLPHFFSLVPVGVFFLYSLTDRVVSQNSLFSPTSAEYASHFLRQTFLPTVLYDHDIFCQHF